MRYRRPMSGGKRVLAVLLCVIVAVTALFVALDVKVRPIIKEMAESEAESYCNLIISDAITEAMEQSTVRYSDLVSVTPGSDTGTPGVLSANIAAINTLKAELTAVVQKKMDAYDKNVIELRMGTLLGSTLFTDRGPMVHVRIIPVSNVRSSISNQFTSAGINQTLHRIMMQIVVDVSVILPGYSTMTTVTTDFCIAETIIIGAVPQSYFEVKPNSQ